MFWRHRLPPRACYRPRMRTLPVFLALALAACGPASVSATSDSVGEEASSSSGSDSTAETESSTTQGESSSETETGEVPDACGCEDSELCAATCTTDGPGFPPARSEAVDLRCVEAPDCVPGELENLACRTAACGSVFHELVTSCGPDDAAQIDLRCSAYEPISCTVAAQDCPEGEKCSYLPPELDDLEAVCVEIIADGQAGDPCTGDGLPELTDSCGIDSMCWGETSSSEPFAGTCRRFCLGMTPGCPEGESCESVAEGMQLCMPEAP